MRLKQLTHPRSGVRESEKIAQFIFHQLYIIIYILYVIIEQILSAPFLFHSQFALNCPIQSWQGQAFLQISLIQKKSHSLYCPIKQNRLSVRKESWQCLNELHYYVKPQDGASGVKFGAIDSHLPLPFLAGLYYTVVSLSCHMSQQTCQPKSFKMFDL